MNEDQFNLSARRDGKILGVILRSYLFFTAIVFSGTAAAKLLSDFSDTELKSYDPFLRFLTAGQLIVLVSLLEIGVVVYVLFNFFRRPIFALRSVMWLSSLFACYRIGFAFAPSEGESCKCWGVGSLLGKMDDSTVDLASMILLATMLTIGGVLMWLTRKNRTAIHPKRDNNKRLSAMAVLGLLFLNFSNLNAQDLTFKPLFTAQGVTGSESLNFHGEIVYEGQTFFEVSKDDQGNWQINTKVDMPAEDDVDATHSSYDGTNIYSSLYYSSDKKVNGKLIPLKNHHSFGTITRGSFPIDLSFPDMMTWLGFLGGDYLSRNIESRIPNFSFDPAGNPVSWAFDLDYQLHPTARSPVLQIGAFRLNPSLLFKDLIHYPEVREPPGAEELQALEFTIQNYMDITNPATLTMTTFEVKEIVDEEKFAFPKQMTWEDYDLHPTNQQLRYLSWRGTLRVTNWVAHPIRETRLLLPKLVGTNVDYQDYRFRFRDENGYLPFRLYALNDHIWPVSTNDPRIAWGRGEHQSLPRVSTVNRASVYYTNLIMGIILLLVPVAIFARNLWRRSKQEAN